MRNRSVKAASVATAALLGIVALAAYARLPTGAQLPVHWNAAGEADRFASASYALAIPVVLCAGLSSIFSVLPRIEPLQDHMQGSASLLRATWFGVLGMMLLLEAVVAAPAFGIVLPAILPLAGAGALLIVVGNVLPKSRPGFFVGIRTPWTVIDPENWIATHRLGAWTSIGGGVGIVLAAVLPLTGDVRAAAVFAALAFAVLPPVVYSFLFWHRRNSRA